ncbi:O-antigen polymerase [Sulfuricurvum kujiense DSM 16994]|uniref:O-antigen polymerase n=1 Tax=Sulfuricurvum kujiense (strain ATCC BAA-921 / DSM 16994 / JCM 11577 / YK-1) TaxID=709032 RepID=E4U391_SULKY|nr:O-antigen ligase family protein [Sulfuricurvum kujiense]ADR34788.1 O-antigen polymerase [Sulfuricurvum kujiense DSM 16994]
MNHLYTKFLELRSDKDRLTLWMNNLIVVYMFFVPITAAVTSRIFIVILILFFLRGNIVHYAREVWKNRVVRAFSYFLMVYFIWLIGSDSLINGWHSISHVKNVLYLFVFLTVIDGRYINRIIGAFIVAMMVSEILSYSMFFGIIPWEFGIGDRFFYKAFCVGDPSPFLHHIHYGVVLAFTVVLLAQKVLYAKEDIRLKAIMFFFTLTASANIFVTGGRTGYIAFFPLLAFFFFYYHRKWILPALIGISIFAGAMYQSSDLLQNKVAQTVIEIEKLAQPTADFDSSLGQRVGFWIYSLEVIKDNFWFGVGTGDSMDEVFKRVLPKDDEVKSIAHEHNQYISVMLQFGLIGLLAFLNIFYQIYKYRPKDESLRFIQLAITMAIAMGLTMTIFNLRVFLHLWILMLAVSMIDRKHRSIQRDIQENRVFLFQVIGIGAVFYTAVFIKGFF